MRSLSSTFCTEDIIERHLSSHFYAINYTQLKLSDIIKTNIPERNAKEKQDEDDIGNQALIIIATA